MVLLDFSIFPLDKGESLGKYVAQCVDVIDRSGITYRTHSMGTTLEGDFDDALAVVKQCFDALAVDCRRIECAIKIDYRKGRAGRLDAKVASIERELSRAVNK
ncbi:MAG: MTH1187 family thiamine-binding protein [Pirellulales bacterium]|nr:MTH1187 family thiamine-binding protein [Pirellulales bacterium]